MRTIGCWSCDRRQCRVGCLVNVTLRVDTLIIQLGKDQYLECKAHIFTTSLVEKERDATAGQCDLIPDVTEQ